MCKALFTYAEDLVVALNPALAKKTQSICHIHVTCVVPVILPEKNMKLQFPVAIHSYSLFLLSSP
jgi:CDP-diacylglycerol pyrophosphatase